MALTPVAKRLTVEVLLHFLTTVLRSVATGIFKHPVFLMRGERSNRLEYLVVVHLHVLHELSLCYTIIIERYYFVVYPQNKKKNISLFETLN